MFLISTIFVKLKPILGIIIDKILYYLIEIVYSFARKKINNLLIGPFKKRKYLQNLKYLLSKMPFIYHDEFNYEVLTNYIEIEIENISSYTYKKAPESLYKLQRNERFKYKKRIIFLGDAGMGKSTFFRYVILKYLQDKKSLSYFGEKELLMPIYIPLRTVDNLQPYPIYKYINKNCGFIFKSNKKMFNKKLLLILDGYDEISYANSPNQYIQDELNMIFYYDFYKNESKKSYSQVSYSERHQTFLSYLQKCRVWLSSRVEFFNFFPIISNSSYDDNVQFLRIMGLGQNRIKLINNIFNY